jgi:hypothetical protein
MTRAGIALGLAAIFTAQTADGACLMADQDGQEAEGRLERVKVTTEAYRQTETAFLLLLSKPACLEGKSEYDKVESSKRIHVFSMDEGIRRKLRKNVGKTVRVRGWAFGEHTVHHHAPIVLNVTGFVERR